MSRLLLTGARGLFVRDNGVIENLDTLLKATQLALFGGPPKEIKEPGKRGGKFYRSKRGKVRYGEQPRSPDDVARIAAERAAHGGRSPTLDSFSKLFGVDYARLAPYDRGRTSAAVGDPAAPKPAEESTPKATGGAMHVHIGGVEHPVQSLAEASEKVREYIEAHDMGATQWHESRRNGRVSGHAHRGYTVALSYNGRAWRSKMGQKAEEIALGAAAKPHEQTAEAKEPAGLDAQTDEHLRAWLDRYVAEGERETVEQGIRAFVAAHPTILESKGWPDIRRLVERNAREGIG